MLIFDQLKQDDPQLRLLTVVVLGGMVVLLAALWWVQVVSARNYQENLETQSFRTVRIPAVRGKILDRNGIVLAENQPSYNVSLYLEELRGPFDAAYHAQAREIRGRLTGAASREGRLLGHKLSTKEKKAFTLDAQERNRISEQTHYCVASNVVQQVSRRLGGQPLTLDFTNFERHFEESLALPYPVPEGSIPSKSRASRSKPAARWAWTWKSNPCACIPAARPRRICSATSGATTARWRARTPFFLPAARLPGRHRHRSRLRFAAPWQGGRSLRAGEQPGLPPDEKRLDRGRARPERRADHRRAASTGGRTRAAGLRPDDARRRGRHGRAQRRSACPGVLAGV